MAPSFNPEDETDFLPEDSEERNRLQQAITEGSDQDLIEEARKILRRESKGQPDDAQAILNLSSAKLAGEYLENYIGNKYGSENNPLLNALRERMQVDQSPETEPPVAAPTPEAVPPEPPEQPERDEVELRNSLDNARKAYISARQNSLKYAGAKRILGVFGGKGSAAERELGIARDKYQATREAFVEKRVDAFIDEKSKLADEAINQAKENVKHPSFGEKIYSAYKKLGEINLLKAYEKIRGKEVEGKVKKAVLRSLSVRTAIGYGLLGVAGATAGSLVGIAAFSAKRVWSGTGTSMGTYAGLEALHSRDVLKKPSEKEMEKLKGDESLLLGKINEMEAWAEFHHEKISDNPLYVELRNAYKSKIEDRGDAVQAQINELMRKGDEALEDRLKNHTWRREGRKVLAGIAGGLVASGAIGEAYEWAKNKLGFGAQDVEIAEAQKPPQSEFEGPPEVVGPPKPTPEQGWTNTIRNDELGPGRHDSAWYSTKQLFAQHTELQEKFPLRPGETQDHWAERMTANAVQYTEEQGTNVPSLVHEGDVVHLKLAPDGKHFEIALRPDSGYAIGELPEKVVDVDSETSDTDAQAPRPEGGGAQENIPTQEELEQDALATKKIYQYDREIEKVITDAQANEGKYALTYLQDTLRDNLRIDLKSSNDAGSFIRYLGEDKTSILQDHQKTQQAYEEFLNQGRQNVYNIRKLLPNKTNQELLIAYERDDTEHFGYVRKIRGGIWRDKWGFDLDGDGIVDGPKMGRKEILSSLKESSEEVGQSGGDIDAKSIDIDRVPKEIIAHNINNLVNNPDQVPNLDLPTMNKLRHLGAYKEIIKDLTDDDPKKEVALQNIGKIIDDINQAQPSLLKK